MGSVLGHFMTVHKHRKLVRQNCFKVGLYWQGLTHDLSKYSFTEFWVGAKYYQGYRSPNNAEREDIGYSSSWLHHKGRNKHHYEYWIDYSSELQNGSVIPIDMPDRYLVEMVMDRIAASKVYKGKDYNDACPLEYLNKGRDRIVIHPNTLKRLSFLLEMLADKGEEYTFEYIKKEIL